MGGRLLGPQSLAFLLPLPWDWPLALKWSTTTFREAASYMQACKQATTSCHDGWGSALHGPMHTQCLTTFLMPNGVMLEVLCMKPFSTAIWARSL